MRNWLGISRLFLKRNSSTILTCVGTVGVVTTSVMAVKATPKAMKLLQKAKNEKGEELTKFEKVTVAGPAYIPATVMGVSTIACIVGANSLNKHQQASMASAYALLNTSYKEYKAKVADIHGEEKEEEIRNEIAKDHYDGQGVTNSKNVLFYDEFSQRYFESTIEKVQKAEYYINRDMAMRDYAYLNEFYEWLGIDTIESGWKLGWSIGCCLDLYWQNWIDFDHSKVTLDDGTECIKILMFQEPIPDFEDYW
jgi:hypothetical protein